MMDNPRWVVATLALLYLLTPSTVDASMHLQQQDNVRHKKTMALTAGQFPNNGIIQVSFNQTMPAFNAKAYFTQTCSGACPAQTYSFQQGSWANYGLTLTTDGRITGTPNAAAAAAKQISNIIVGSDGDGPNATAPITLQIVSTVIFSGPIPNQSGKSQATFTLNLAQYFSDPSLDLLTYTVNGLPSQSSLPTNPTNGIFTGKLGKVEVQASQQQPLTLTVVASNTQGKQATSNQFTLQVDPFGPEIVTPIPDQATTEGSATPYRGSFSTNFRDVDGYTLTYTIDSTQWLSTSGLTFDGSTGILQGTATAAAVGTRALQVCATNGLTTPICSPFNLLVTARAKQAPVCTSPDQLSRETEQQIRVDLSTYCRDPDSTTPLTYTISSGFPANSQLRLDSSGLLFGVVTSIEANAPQPLQLEILVTDADGDTTTVRQDLVVTLKNSPPILTNIANTPVTAQGGAALSVDLSTWFQDVDGDSKTYSLSAPGIPPTSGLIFNSVTGQLSGTPNAADIQAGRYILGITCSDGRGGTSQEATLILNFVRGNKPPVAFPVPIPDSQVPKTTVGKIWTWNIGSYFTDEDAGDKLTYRLQGLPLNSGFSATSNDGVITAVFNNYDVAATENGPKQITIIASDGTDEVENYFNYQVVVPPACTAIPSTDIPLAYQTQNFQFSVAGYCSSRFTMTYSMISNHTDHTFNALTIDSTTGLISGVIPLFQSHQAGQVTILYTVDDGRGGRTNNTFVIFIQEVIPPTKLPCAPPAAGSTFVNYPISFNAGACFGGQNLLFSMTGTPIGTGLSINRNSGLITGTLNQADGAAPQPIMLNVTADDQKGGKSSQMLPITVQFVTPPTFVNIPTIPDVKCGDFCCNWGPKDYVSDPNGNALTFSLAPNGGFPAGSSLKLATNTGSISGIASSIDVLNSPITINVLVDNKQPAGPAPMAPITFNVIGKSPPTVKSDIFAQTVKVDALFYLDASNHFTNPDPSSPLVYSVNPTSPLQIDSATGVLQGTFTEQDYFKNPSINFEVIAENTGACGGGQARTSFVITISPDFQSPVSSGKPANQVACEGEKFALNLSPYFSDPRGDLLTFQVNGLPAGSGLSLNATTGILSGVPNEQDTQAGVVTVNVGARNSISAYVQMDRFEISFGRGKRPPVADPPIPSPVTAIQGQRFIGYFNFHFYEPEWEPLIYSVAGLPPGSNLGIGPVTGIFSGSPNEADFRASPMVLSVFASNEHNAPSGNNMCPGRGGRARADFILVIEKAPEPPICNPIPAPNSPANVGQFWLLDVSSHFRPGVSGGKIEYALRSLPRGTGLTIDPYSGVISGVITQADANNAPLLVGVAVTNGFGQCQSQFQLSIGGAGGSGGGSWGSGGSGSWGSGGSGSWGSGGSGGSGSWGGGSGGNFGQTCPINAFAVATQNAREGERFQLDLQSYFAPYQNVQVTYHAVGLPPGTGFVLEPNTGILSGTPSPADAAARTILVEVAAHCGGVGAPITKQFQLIVAQRSCQVCDPPSNGGCQQNCFVKDPNICQPTCSCNPGYVLGYDGRTCAVADPCSTSSCEKICQVQNGQPVCSCPKNEKVCDHDPTKCCRDPCANNRCEQIAIVVDTASGPQCKCDCRMGTPRPDGTCATEIISTGTIPPGLVVGCQTYMHDFSRAFRYNGPSPASLRFSVTSGLPQGTGFSITSAGIFSGVPSPADCARSQPMSVQVSATDGFNAAQAVLFLSAFCDNQKPCVNQQIPGQYPVPIPSDHSSIPLLWAMVCVEFRFDVADYFVHVGEPLQYSLLTLPYGTGLRMEPSGIVHGVPTHSDCHASPLSMTVVGKNRFGNEYKALLNIKFRSCDCQQPMFGVSQQWQNQQTQQWWQTQQGQQGQQGQSNPQGQQWWQTQQNYQWWQNQQDQQGSDWWTGSSQPGKPEQQWWQTQQDSYWWQNQTGNGQQGQNWWQNQQGSQQWWVDQQQSNTTNGNGQPGQQWQQQWDPQWQWNGNMNTGGGRVPVPYPVEVRVEVPVPVHIPQPYPEYVEVGIPVPVPVPIEVFVEVPREVQVPVPVPVEVQVPYPEYVEVRVPRPYPEYIEVPVEVPREVVVEIPVRVPVPFEVVVEETIEMVYPGVRPGVYPGVYPIRPGGAHGHTTTQTGTLTQQHTSVVASTQHAHLHVHADAQCGQPFFYDTAELFKVKGLTYSIKGLPPRSGLAITKTGVISGAPNTADANAVNPLRAEVTGVDKYGASVVLTVNIEVRGDCTGVPLPAASPAPQGSSYRDGGILSELLGNDPFDLVTGILPVQTAHKGQKFLLNLARLALGDFQGPVGFKVKGLPRRSGLKATSQGTIEGKPSKHDCIASPLKLKVSAESLGDTSEVDLFIRVLCGERSSAPIVSGSLPPAVGALGSLFFYNVANYITGNDVSALSFFVEGLPEGSALRMSKNGVLSGMVSEVDMRAAPVTVGAVDRAGNTARATLEFNMVERKVGNAPAVFLPLKTLQAFEGHHFVLNVAQRFYDSEGDELKISLRGLPRESGLSFDGDLGVLSGVPTKEDANQFQPMRLIAVATDSTGASTEGTLYLHIVSATGKNADTMLETLPEGTNRAPVSTPIVRRTAVEGEPFLMGVSSSFFDQDGDFLSYKLSGLPVGTGLSIDSINGVISGTPSRADAYTRQPLTLTVTVADEQGGLASESFLLTVFQGDVQDTKNHNPVAEPMQAITATAGSNFIYRASKHFADADGDSLSYSMTGLPEGSGLKIQPSAGIISGIPSAADALSSPLELVVRGEDGKGGVAESLLVLTVDKQRRPGKNTKPTSKSMPAMEVGDGDRLEFSAAEFFSDSDGDNLQYSVYGLPKGTGFELDQNTGLLSGSPARADFNAKQPLVVGFVADDGRGGRAGEILSLRVESRRGYRSGLGMEVPDVLVGLSTSHSGQGFFQAGAPEVTFQAGTWGFFQGSRYFPAYDGINSGITLTFAIEGLPEGSGLSIDSKSGVISGTPSLMDIVAADSQSHKRLPLTIYARYAAGAESEDTSSVVEQLVYLKFTSVTDDDTNRAPIARTIPKVTILSTEHMIINVATSFSDADGDDLTYSIVGLPEQSGLTIVPPSGILFGYPSPADVNARQPLVLTVVVEDEHGARAQETLVLEITTAEQVQEGLSPQEASVGEVPAVSALQKSCEQLGWATKAGAKVCSRSPRIDGECPAEMDFEEAEAICESIGARLCSAQELSDARFVEDSSQCLAHLRVWTSSRCAFPGRMITRAGMASHGDQFPQECSDVLFKSAHVKCCAEASADRDEVSTSTATVKRAVSNKQCQHLRGFLVPTYSENKHVCSKARVRPAGEEYQCSGAVTFAEATSLCQNLGARLCTSEELAQDVARGTGCSLDAQRVWTATECPYPDQVLTRAGSSAFSERVPQKCTMTDKKLPVQCCGDFEAGHGFSLDSVIREPSALELAWSWRAYPEGAVVSYKGSGEEEWVEALSGRIISGGTVRLEDLEPDTEYKVNITPLKARGQPGKKLVKVSHQSVHVELETTRP